MSAEVRVRGASPDDLDELVPLVLAYQRFYEVERDGTDVEDYLRRRLGPGDAVVLVAEAPPDGAVGFALSYPTWDTLTLAARWILHDLYVAPTHRRLGVGRALLRATVAAAARAGAGAVSLETAHTNTIAQPLYESEGFVLDRTYRTYHRELAAA